MSSDWHRALVALSAPVVAAALVAILYFARTLLIPVVLAVLLAFVLWPVVARLHRRGLGRTTSVVVTVGLVVLVAVSVGAVIAQQVVHLAETLPDRRDAIRARVIAARQWRHASDKAQHWAGDAYEATAEAVESFGTELTNLVRKHPLPALLIGFGLGLLIGRTARSL
jgi:predicted PurR-regulated permease PerM